MRSVHGSVGPRQCSVSVPRAIAMLVAGEGAKTRRKLTPGPAQLINLWVCREVMARSLRSGIATVWLRFRLGSLSFEGQIHKFSKWVADVNPPVGCSGKAQRYYKEFFSAKLQRHLD